MKSLFFIENLKNDGKVAQILTNGFLVLRIKVEQNCDFLIRVIIKAEEVRAK
jgi:hypothetical protein